MRKRRLILSCVLLAALTLARPLCGAAPDKLSGYAYEDTRQLVALVEQAAKLMEEQGENAFSEFGAVITQWRVLVLVIRFFHETQRDLGANRCEANHE